MNNMFVQITNWKELKEQFTNLGKDYKSPIEICRNLLWEIQRNGIVKQIAIDYETDNIDSGICVFEYVKTLNNTVYYEYTGTAK